MKSIIVLLVGTLFTACDSSAPYCPVSSKGACGIGQAFYLPDLSIMDDNGNGERIFEEMAPSCLEFVPSYINKEEKDYFEDANTFYNKLGSQTGLSEAEIEGFTLGPSLDAASSFIDYKKMDVKGASMDVFAITGFYDVKPECLTITPFTKEFARAFENLPARIKNPHKSSSWYLYDAILQDFGSHIITRISYGSRLTKYTFTKSSVEASGRDLFIKTCASMGEINIGACQGFNDTDYSRVKSISASHQLVVRGGLPETRAKLVSELTNELLTEFLSQANETNQAVSEKFHSIWGMLKKRYLGTPHFVKAVNLEAYYKGYLAAGCSYKKEDEVVLQKFVLVEDDINVPGYECQLAPRGCRGDQDCHHHIGPCYCHGPGCVNGRPRNDPRHSVRIERFIKKESDTESTWGGVNNSCKMQMGVMCTCDKKWGGGWETVWPDQQYMDNDMLLREAQSRLRKFNRK